MITDAAIWVSLNWAFSVMYATPGQEEVRPRHGRPARLPVPLSLGLLGATSTRRAGRRMEAASLSARNPSCPRGPAASACTSFPSPTPSRRPREEEAGPAPNQRRHVPTPCYFQWVRLSQFSESKSRNLLTAAKRSLEQGKKEQRGRKKQKQSPGRAAVAPRSQSQGASEAGSGVQHDPPQPTAPPAASLGGALEFRGSMPVGEGKGDGKGVAMLLEGEHVITIAIFLKRLVY